MRTNDQEQLYNERLIVRLSYSTAVQYIDLRERVGKLLYMHNILGILIMYT